MHILQKNIVNSTNVVSISKSLMQLYSLLQKNHRMHRTAIYLAKIYCNLCSRHIKDARIHYTLLTIIKSKLLRQIRCNANSIRWRCTFVWAFCVHAMR